MVDGSVCGVLAERIRSVDFMSRLDENGVNMDTVYSMMVRQAGCWLVEEKITPCSMLAVKFAQETDPVRSLFYARTGLNRGCWGQGEPYLE